MSGPTRKIQRWAVATVLCAALWQGCDGDVDEGEGTPTKQAGSGGDGEPGPSAGASATGGRSGSGGPGGGSGGTGGGGGKAGAGGTSGGGGVHTDGFYRMEALDRGLVAVQADDGVYLGWRMLGFEYDRDNPERVTYRVYRDGAMIADVSGSTNHRDADGEASSSYTVTAVIDGDEGAASPAVTPWTTDYLRIPLDPPSSTHSANDASAADLDGDGQYELILKWDPADAKDNSQKGVTSSVYLDGLELDGTPRFRIDLGPNIRAGAHYTQFIVYDFDGDGKAELAVKTAPGTRDGTGAYLSNGPAADDDDSEVYRNADGYVLRGPEYLSVFSGDTGAELATVNFDVPRGNVADWGDDYGNRVDRFLATAAYLDDTGLPSFVMARGYYTRTTLTAWNFRDGALTQLWKFDSDQTPEDAEGHPFTGQGTHSLSVANTDDDKPQEIIYGAMTVDHDGHGNCSTGLGHGDALHVSDFVLDRPGLESFMPHENSNTPYWSLRDADNCEILHQGMITDGDIGRGVAADVLPDNPGAEMWSAGGIPLLSSTDASEVGPTPSSINFVIWWDGDESRELENGTAISKYGGGTLQQCDACESNNGSKSTPTLTADLLGDWREEVIWRETDNRGLRLYTTTLPTQRRIYTLMHDPQYRIAISWQNVAYNQPPHPSFQIGEGMAAPPRPDIRTGE
jgi:rhamnogalacturonan endolyase